MPRVFAGLLVVLACWLPSVSCSHELSHSPADAATSPAQNQATSSQKTAATPQRNGKVAIPEIKGCSRDQVTFYKGKVLAFKRNDKFVEITVRTEWDTTEKRAQDNSDNSIEFRLKGQPLTDDDRKRVESLLANNPEQVQVTVWTCNPGSKEQIKIIDWDPPAAK
jgi:hypothetical protein